MRKIAGSVALIAVVVIIMSCASDIFLKEPPSLKGLYKGLYIVTELGEQPVEYKQRIDWKFTDLNYNMSIDEDDPNWDPDFCICKVYGEYKLENRVELTQAQQGVPHAGCSTCRDDWSPQGAFDLDRSTDTLKLTRSYTDPNILIEIKLLPASGP